MSRPHSEKEALDERLGAIEEWLVAIDRRVQTISRFLEIKDEDDHQ